MVLSKGLPYKKLQELAWEKPPQKDDDQFENSQRGWVLHKGPPASSWLHFPFVDDV